MTESTSAPNISMALSSLTTPRRCPETRAHYAHRWAPGGMWADCPGGPQEDASPPLVAAERERVLAEFETLLDEAETGADHWGACSHEWLRIGDLRALVARLWGQG